MIQKEKETAEVLSRYFSYVFVKEPGEDGKDIHSRRDVEQAMVLTLNLKPAMSEKTSMLISVKVTGTRRTGFFDFKNLC